MQAYRLTLIVELEAEDLDAAGEIGKTIWERFARPISEIEGVRWLLPVGDFKEREPFAIPYGPEAAEPPVQAGADRAD